MNDVSEPQITINGVALNEAQAMTVRIAVTSFLMDVTGELAAQLGFYEASLREIIAIMINRPERQKP